MATVQRDGLVGRTVDGRYTVLAHLADGGMGRVYAALDERLDRQVALKVMRPDLARDPAFVDRFRREARAAARLSHPHVVAVYDQGEDDGILFLAMEFVDGQTLRDLLEEEGALTPREALRITARILEGTAAAHRRDVLHRDIKPENVLCSAEGRVAVADFGLARAVGSTTATAAGAPLLGTVAYLAPEQVEHGTADRRTDLYAIGLVLHEMLTGRPAVEGDSPIHVAWQHVTGSIPPPSDRVPELPAAIDDLVARATARDPEDRHDDAEVFLADVHRVLAELPDSALDHRAEPPTPPSTGGEEEDEDGHAGRDGDRRSQETSTIARRTRTIPRLGSEGRPANVAAVSTGGSMHSPSDLDDAHPLPEVDPAATPRRFRRRGAAALTVLLLGMGGGWWWFGPPGERTVPEVVGTEIVAAEETLRGEDLSPVTDRVFSETVPRDHVVESDAPAGTLLRRGSRVRLLVSRGPERYDVPELTGRTVAEAHALLSEAHLTVAPGRRSTYHDTVERGRVVVSAPAAGSRVKPGTPVALTVSKGREPVSLGGVVGTSEEEARAALEKKGLTVRVADERVFSTSVPAGRVASTSPTGTVHRGDAVTLTVSKGPEMVPVPLRAGSPRGAGGRHAPRSGLRGPGRTDPRGRVRHGTLDRARRRHRPQGQHGRPQRRVRSPAAGPVRGRVIPDGRTAPRATRHR
ncbi:Stk1 family PASTA domain-containing Ser/Thr kinase [Mobilicoccus pelagius]|uniref:non-specific serine/threonine protein kinase n=1 Tax=Mobilicoccus pelagius NBRC 104925 TaxID=1089455 RepID=H5UUR9_9MICO|nr:Stk1 family PASTA domain-containing Ser/Thr kinase [Mobilicoccus pelagius]GAB49477.1 serine/threonine protein kinase PkaF [Mobilicoccus pelagius NBRC 104925]